MGKNRDLKKNNKEHSTIKMDVPFFQCPNGIFDKDSMELDIYQKIVYIYLCRCGNQGADAFPSYETIGKKCGMSRRKAINVVKELIKKGLLTKEVDKDEVKGLNFTNDYYVNYKILSKESTESTESTGSAGDAPPKNANNEGGSASTALPSEHDAPPPSEQDALGSACHAPYKEPLKKNPSEKETKQERTKENHSPTYEEIVELYKTHMKPNYEFDPIEPKLRDLCYQCGYEIVKEVISKEISDNQNIIRSYPTVKMCALQLAEEKSRRNKK